MCLFLTLIRSKERCVRKIQIRCFFVETKRWFSKFCLNKQKWGIDLSKHETINLKMFSRCLYTSEVYIPYIWNFYRLKKTIRFNGNKIKYSSIYTRGSIVRTMHHCILYFPFQKDIFRTTQFLFFAKCICIKPRHKFISQMNIFITFHEYLGHINIWIIHSKFDKREHINKPINFGLPQYVNS